MEHEVTELEHFCQVVVDLINQRDFGYESREAQRLREQHISADWSGKLDCHAWSIDFDEQTEVWRQMTLEHPGVHLELIGVDTKVREGDRTADVVMRTALMQGDVKFQTLCQFKWKFCQNKWMWCHHSGMRGVCEIEI